MPLLNQPLATYSQCIHLQMCNFGRFQDFKLHERERERERERKRERSRIDRDKEREERDRERREMNSLRKKLQQA